MAIELVVPGKDQLKAFSRTLSTAFGKEQRPAEEDRWAGIIEPERLLAARHGDTIVGTAGAFTFNVTVPGGPVPAAGVTLVGVLPSHRRRGVLTALMRRQLYDVRDRGEPVAILWASESGIYGRFGYGVASHVATTNIERDRAVFADPSGAVGKTTLVSVDEAVKILPEVYDRVAADVPGMYSRSERWWKKHTLMDPERDRDGGGPMFHAVWEDGGKAGAYALYRQHPRWEDDGLPSGWVEVIEVVTTSALATREIWRFLFGIDLASSVKSWFLALDDPLFLIVKEPRRLRPTLHDGIWLRIVDVPEALRVRSYAADGTLVIEVRDVMCEWNSGRWRVDASPSGGEVNVTDDAPDLVMDVRDLGSAYLGGVSFTRMALAGLVEEKTPRAAFNADALFRTERAPWCPEIF